MVQVYTRQKINDSRAFFERHKKNTCQIVLMYLTGIKQLGVEKSFSDALVQYQLNNRLIISNLIFIKLFSQKTGSASPHFPKYSPILVGSEIMPSAELCIY